MKRARRKPTFISLTIEFASLGELLAFLSARLGEDDTRKVRAMGARLERSTTALAAAERSDRRAKRKK